MPRYRVTGVQSWRTVYELEADSEGDARDLAPSAGNNVVDIIANRIARDDFECEHVYLIGSEQS